MSVNRVEKGCLQLKGSQISIFGCTGYTRSGKWNTNFFRGIEVETPPEPVSRSIEASIERSFINNCEDDIKYIQAMPNVAVCLYLEGRLNCDDVKNALVDKEKECVTFRNIEFNTKKGLRGYDILVTNEPPIKGVNFIFATMNCRGEVI